LKWKAAFPDFLRRTKEATMQSTFWRAVTVWGLLVAAAPCAATAQQAATVNSYTPAEEQRARGLARSAGYQPGIITMVQAGNFFMNATRAGHRYQITVTADGKLFASDPIE
jgi:hypothetical protein